MGHSKVLLFIALLLLMSTSGVDGPLLALVLMMVAERVWWLIRKIRENRRK